VVVKLLLEKGAELESKDNDGRTPLSWAAKNGHKAVVKLLLEKGAELESKDRVDGRTPLSWAAENGHSAVVKLLLEKAPSWSPRIIMVERRYRELRRAGTRTRVMCYRGLRRAGTGTKILVGRRYRLLRRWGEAAVKLLLEKGAELESKDKDGQIISC
jgi:hypothetical protein